MNQEPRFEKRDAFRVVGMHVRAKAGSDAFSKLWDEFIPHAEEVSGRIEENTSYGVEWDMDNETQEFNYLAGFAVGEEAPIPTGMMDVQVPAQEYAVFDFSLQQIGDAMKFIFEEWLPASDFKHSGGPEFEYYDDRFNPAEDRFEMSMYVPIVKK